MVKKPAAPFYEKTSVESDQKLLDRMRTGDESVLVELYQRNYFMVRKLVCSNNGSEHDVEDLLQETLVLLWQNVTQKGFELTAKISTYVYAVVRNLWLRELRKRKHGNFNDTENFDIPDNGPDVLEGMIDREDYKIMMDCVAQMGDTCKQLLLMFYFEGKNMQEIAEALDFRNSDVAKAKKWQCKQELIKKYEDFVKSSAPIE